MTKFNRFNLQLLIIRHIILVIIPITLVCLILINQLGTKILIIYHMKIEHYKIKFFKIILIQMNKDLIILIILMSNICLV
jgi:hypothetical protein